MSVEPVKFLLVDDVEENLLMLETLLRRDDLVILKAHSGVEALELLLVHEVALAFLDVHMPDMDGFELAESMRGTERTRHVPIIFVTAENRDPLRLVKGYESGAVDFLYKPIDPRILQSKADVFFELSRQRKEYVQALQMNEMFVGMLGHDLRNPLGALLTGAQLLETQTADEKQLRTLRRMTSAGRRMRDMIEQLLDLTRARLLDGVGLASSRSQLDVASLVQRTVEELQGAFPEQQVVFRSAGKCVSTGDADRLLQLFSNLIANALQHGQSGGTVTVDVGCGAQEMKIVVHNDGVIPAELLSSLFQPFRKRQAMRARSKGLGLGLYISRQIALAHGGSVDVESGPASGTVVTVRLPWRSADESRSEDAQGRKTVLVVDDDRVTRESLQEAFEREGYDVVTALDGLSALERLGGEQRRPDVIVLDVVLPLSDGGSLYEAMQADPNLARIPIVSCVSDDEAAFSNVVVIPKPFRLERLLKTVANLCEGADRIS